MKEFMFIFKGPYPEDLGLSAAEAEANMHKWFGWVNELKTKGIYVEGRPLHKGGKMVAGKDQLITDGPFTESKEVVGGYFIIKAGSMEEALKLTKGYPDFELQGSIEVREVMLIPASV